MRIAILVATAALAACSQQSSTTTATTADGNTTASAITTTADVNTTASTATSTTSNTGLPSAKSLGLQPGKWETKVSVISMVVNGVSRPAPPIGQSVLTCVTPEMAAKGPGEMLKKAGVDCTSTNTSYAGGKIAAQMKCKLPMGVMTSTTTGTYSPTAMTSDAEATVSGRMSIREKIHTEARRVGACG